VSQRGATRGQLALEAIDGRHERGLIGDPRSKAKSVALTDGEARLDEQLFAERFGAEDAGTE
jgi:hypothetical protein